MDRKQKTVTSIVIEKSFYLKIRAKLLKIGKSFSKWVQEKIIEDLNK